MVYHQIECLTIYFLVFYCQDGNIRPRVEQKAQAVRPGVSRFFLSPLKGYYLKNGRSSRQIEIFRSSRMIARELLVDFSTETHETLE